MIYKQVFSWLFRHPLVKTKEWFVITESQDQYSVAFRKSKNLNSKFWRLPDISVAGRNHRIITECNFFIYESFFRMVYFKRFEMIRCIADTTTSAIAKRATIIIDVPIMIVGL